MNARTFVGVLFCVVMCVAATSGQVQAQPRKLEKVNYGTVITLEGDLPLMIAQKKGFFADEGLEVNVVILGGALTREALLSGDVKFALLHVSALWPAVQKGLPLKFISLVYTKEIFSVVASDRLKGQAKSLSDLKGRRVMAFAPGGASYAAAVYYFKQAGMDLTKDVELITVSTGDPRVWMNALQTGKVDALAATWDPTVSTVLAHGLGFLLLDIRDPAVHERLIGGDSTTIGIAVTESTIKDNPELVQRFQRALNRGLAHIHGATPEELATLVESTGLVQLDKALLTKNIASMKPNYPRNGVPSRAAYDRASKMYVEAGYLKEAVPFESVFSAIAK
jgi:NitT/TauT family transport system substrate-binding protein